MANVNIGTPGIGTATRVSPRDILVTTNGAIFRPGYAVIDGSKCRDAGNSNVNVLRGGYLVSYDRTDKKFKGTILGQITSKYVSGETTLNVSAATATEISRRFGSSGTANFYIVGDVDLGSGDEETSATMIAVTHSAVGATTITVSDLADNLPQHSFLIAREAVLNAANAQLTETYPIYDRYGIRVTDDNDASMDVDFAYRLTSGILNTDMIVDYPSTNAGLARWLKDELKDTKIGLSFSDDN